eukprot:gene6050-7270_t
MRTDRVENVVCVPGDATTGIEFARVEVVNYLGRQKVFDIIKAYGVDYDRLWIHDSIRHEMNRFCSARTSRAVYLDEFALIGDKLRATLQKKCDGYANGVVIVDVRVAMPAVVPDRITKIFEAEEAEEAAKRRIEEEHIEAVAIAERKARERAMRVETSRERAKVESDAAAYRKRTMADSEYYVKVREAEANRVLLTESYLRLQEARIWQNTAKAYFGEKIPNAGSLPTVER